MRDAALTAALWIGYFYLTRDFWALLGALALWATGQAPEPGLLRAGVAVLGTLGSYAAVIVANAALLCGWALYNRMRFRGKDRRSAATPLAVADFAAMYGFPPAEIESWQRARILTMQHAPDGRLVAVGRREAAAADA